MEMFPRVVLGCVGVLAFVTGLHAQAPSVFVPVTPCRIADTRLVAEGSLATGETRFFDVVGVSDYSPQGGNPSGCGIPGFVNGQPQVAATRGRIPRGVSVGKEDPSHPSRTTSL